MRSNAEYARAMAPHERPKYLGREARVGGEHPIKEAAKDQRVTEHEPGDEPRRDRGEQPAWPEETLHRRATSPKRPHDRSLTRRLIHAHPASANSRVNMLGVDRKRRLA